MLTSSSAVQPGAELCAQSSSSHVPKFVLLLALSDLSSGSHIQEVVCRQREFAVSTGLVGSFLIRSYSVRIPD